jgi:hypothetical protein
MKEGLCCPWQNKWSGAGSIFPSSIGMCCGGTTSISCVKGAGIIKGKGSIQLAKECLYSPETIVPILTSMALAGIKSLEQLKQCKPGEIGRLMGWLWKDDLYIWDGAAIRVSN